MQVLDVLNYFNTLVVSLLILAKNPTPLFPTVHHWHALTQEADMGAIHAAAFAKHWLQEDTQVYSPLIHYTKIHQKSTTMFTHINT